MQLGLDALEVDNLEIEPSLGSSGFTLKLRGACDTFAVTPLGGYLTSVFAEMERVGVSEGTFDIRGLTLVNSSCLKQFITFLHKLRSLEADKSYVVEFLVDAKLHWQSRALAAFIRMWPDIVRVTRVGPSDASNQVKNA